MKNLECYKLDLELLIDTWVSGLYGEGLDFVSSHNISILKSRIIDLYTKYDHYDPELEFLFDNDSAGGC